MKTIKQWFEENLPANIQQTAFEDPYFDAETKVESLDLAISSCFL